MRIAVYDDNSRDREQMAELLRACDSSLEAECFGNGRNLLAAAEKMPPFDLAFLDIYLPGEHGMELAENLRALSPSTGIVFTAASPAFAVDAFSFYALHYLVKPVTTEGVSEVLRRLKALQKKTRPLLVLSSGTSIRTLYLDEIIYIQSAGHAKEMNLTGGRQIRVWMALKELEGKLDDTFLKLNRSVLVNMEHIGQMGPDSCILRDGTRLEFARRERAAIRAAYDNYLLERKGEAGLVAKYL